MTGIRSARDAERAAMEWMRSHGYPDAVLTSEGADGGVDVSSADAVAQVKAQVAPVGRPVVQQLAGCARIEGKRGYVFGLGGFTDAAVAWADLGEIGCLTFDLEGDVVPINAWAERVAESFELQPRAWGDDYPAECATTVSDHGSLVVFPDVMQAPMLTEVIHQVSIDLGTPGLVAALEPPHVVVLTEHSIQLFELPDLALRWSQTYPFATEPHSADILANGVVSFLGFRPNGDGDAAQEEAVRMCWRLSDGVAVAGVPPGSEPPSARLPCVVEAGPAAKEVRCRDSEGRTRWTFPCGDLVSGVTRAGNVVLSTVGDALIAIDNRSGSEL